MNEFRYQNGNLKAIELELHMVCAEAGPGDMSRVTLESCDYSAPYHGERLTMDIADEDVRKHFGGRFKVTVSPVETVREPESVKAVPAFADLREDNAAMVTNATCDDLKAAWEVGDELRMHLRASEDGEQPEQDVVWVVMGFDDKRIATGRKSRAVIGLKDCLAEGMAFNAARQWLNSRDGFTSMVPKWLFDLFGITANYMPGKIATDIFWLPSEMEVFGSTQWSDGEMEKLESQLPYYVRRRDRRVKHAGIDGSAGYWWERSPYSGDSSTFCHVGSGGSANWYIASYTLLLAPAGCF